MLVQGQVLHDRYQLQQQLGLNAVRQTWLATDLTSNPPEAVVVKLLAMGGTLQWDDLKLFEREAQVLRQLQHPHIPNYRDYFSIDDRLLWFGLVEDYVPGASLKTMLDQGTKFTEADVIQIATDLLEILVYLHGLNPPVLHRDIKPSNVIWAVQTEENRQGQIYLVDFGAVQDKAAAEGKTFTITGTYGYTPMEQFGGRSVPASDLYALGATLVHLLTGISPADLPQDEALRIMFHDRTSASPHLVQWIHRLIEPAVKRRIATAQQALHALASVRSGLTVATKLQKPPLSYSLEPHLCPANTRVKLKRTSTSLTIELPPVAAPAGNQEADPSSLSSELSGAATLAMVACVGLMMVATWTWQSGFWWLTIPVVAIAVVALGVTAFLMVPSPPHWVTIVLFSDQQFSIDTYRRQDTRLGKDSKLKDWRHGNSANIESCYAEEIETYNPASRQMQRIPSVAIVERINQGAKLEKHTIGSGVLNRAETQWLAAEINLWLHPHHP